MSAEGTKFLERFADWATNQRSIVAAVVFGSHARFSDDGRTRADEWSDVDLHITTTDPGQFESAEWMRDLSSSRPLGYISRSASGGVRKATAVLSSGLQIDVVIIPAFRFRIARTLVWVGLHRKVPAFARALDELATVMRSGFRVIKGGRKWHSFYARVVQEIQGARLSDGDIVVLADEYFCDHLAVVKKIVRGEYVAGQRIIHRSLAETNIRLLHELRLRSGQVSFREARRVERLLNAQDLLLLKIETRPERAVLERALHDSEKAFRTLLMGLIGDRWLWPELPSSLRSK